DLSGEGDRDDREPEGEGRPQGEVHGGPEAEVRRQVGACRLGRVDDVVVGAGPGQGIEVRLEVDDVPGTKGQGHDGGHQATQRDVGRPPLGPEVQPYASVLYE